MFNFRPYLGKIPNLTIIFFRWVETTNQLLTQSFSQGFGSYPSRLFRRNPENPAKITTPTKFLVNLFDCVFFVFKDEQILFREVIN